MSVPDFQSMMLPLLDFCKDKQEHSIHEINQAIATILNVEDDALRELLPSGKQTRFNNRVGWAKSYLQKAHLLQSTRRSYFTITERGLKALDGNPSIINTKFLEQFREYREFRGIGLPSTDKCKTDINLLSDSEQQTPEEQFENAYQDLNRELSQEILIYVKKESPAFFEKLVVELLVKMGYGGSRVEAARAIGKSGDGGIDGIIDEDRLGLDVIYIQAKRWTTNSVSRPEIQKFVGALQGKRAKKGVFITSSEFTAGAREYVSLIDTKVVLIDGKRLAELMIEFDVGVTTTSSYALKKIDTDYFED